MWREKLLPDSNNFYRNHRTSHPVPIPYIPVLHFATKLQHSLSRVEKMSNFALVVPSSIEEGDRL